MYSFLTAYSEHSSCAFDGFTSQHRRAQSGSHRAESDHSRLGRPARIIAKMNALLDKNIITALYRASQAGVEIDLLVRAFTALRQGFAASAITSGCEAS
jgi:polyphosphate kinase